MGILLVPLDFLHTYGDISSASMEIFLASDLSRPPAIRNLDIFQFHERGTNIKFYVTENVPNTWGPLLGNVSTVLGISSDNQRLVQSDGTEMEQLPMFMEYYVTEVPHYPNPLSRGQTSIFLAEKYAAGNSNHFMFSLCF